MPIEVLHFFIFKTTMSTKVAKTVNKLIFDDIMNRI